jgi:hypothetical protein
MFSPGVRDDMENCPASDGKNKLYLFLSSLIGVVLFLCFKGISKLRSGKKSKKENLMRETLRDDDFRELQIELYGDRILELESTRHSKTSTGSSKGRSKHSSTV